MNNTDVTKNCDKITVKPEIRLLGIDDSSLEKNQVLVIGTVFRGGQWLDGVLRTRITKDGMNATDKLIEMITNSRHYKQLRAILLDGITFAGFNIIDIHRLHHETKLPVIVAMRKKPDFAKIKKALTHLNQQEKRWQLIQQAGNIHQVTTNHRRPIYIQFAGLCREDAETIVKLSATRSNIPEPLRAAHIIATGIICGESKRRP